MGETLHQIRQHQRTRQFWLSFVEAPQDALALVIAAQSRHAKVLRLPPLLTFLSLFSLPHPLPPSLSFFLFLSLFRSPHQCGDAYVIVTCCAHVNGGAIALLY